MSIDSAAPVDPAQAPAIETEPAPTVRSRTDRTLTLVGEILITAGVLLSLFVVWQLFYTDVQSDRTQDQALDSLDWVQPVVAAGSEAESTTDIDVVQLIPPDQMHFSPDGAPVVATPDIAETFATIHVPRWGAGYVKPISEGVTRKEVLDPLGIGHYPQTAMPGQVGNFSLGGHRTTYGKPFWDVDKLVLGDKLIIQTEDAWYVYQVVETKIVMPTDVYVIAPNPLQPGSSASKAYITLTTCNPKYSAAQRFIVHGELVYWAPTGHGMPPELYEEL